MLSHKHMPQMSFVPWSPAQVHTAANHLTTIKAGTPGYGNGSSYGNDTLYSPELEEIKRLCILVVTVDSKLTFETYVDKIGSKSVWGLGVVR